MALSAVLSSRLLLATVSLAVGRQSSSFDITPSGIMDFASQLEQLIIIVTRIRRLAIPERFELFKIFKDKF
jgi:hypothetical protein